MRVIVLGLGATALLSCVPAASPGGATLEVYLRSDLSAAELEGATIEARATGASGAMAAPIAIEASEVSLSRLAAPGGALVAVFETLAAGPYEVEVVVSGGGAPGGTSASAAVDFAAVGAQQVVVVVVRDGEATCTTAGDCPDVACAIESCVEGLCFAQRGEEWTEGCACDADAACAGAGECGVGACVEHACVVRPEDEACGATGVCRADLSCDPVSCRGRSAGDPCRPAADPCDPAERCAASERECPPDRRREVGEGCRDDGGATGFCQVDASGGGLVCETSCVAGAACQVGCRIGRTVCVPAPSCDTSGGELAPDGSVCAPAATCVAASTCSAGDCVPGAVTEGAICGADPASECADAPICDAAGVCQIQVRPTGTPCGTPSDAPVCHELRCAPDGVCSPVQLATDPRCPPTLRIGECGIGACRSGPAAEWGCFGVPDEGACGASPPCFRRICRVTLVCLDIPLFDGEPCECGTMFGYYCSGGVCEGCDPCYDGVLTPPESDVDCGGGDLCRGCGPGLRCNDDWDCLSYACRGGLCDDWCSNGNPDFDETDVDCGGPTCPPCASGRFCIEPTDCVSGTCMEGTCT